MPTQMSFCIKSSCIQNAPLALYSDSGTAHTDISLTICRLRHYQGLQFAGVLPSAIYFVI